MTQLEADFCVVGAGISGLSAAYWLHKAESTVIVLEASDRVGGRVWTRRLSNGTPFEIGAQWVSDPGFQPHIRALMDELSRDLHKNIDIHEQYIGGKNAFVDAEGNVSYYDEKLPPPEGLPPVSLLAQADLGAAVLALNQMASVIHSDSRWDRVEFDSLISGGVKDTIAADRMTLHNWIEDNMSEPAAKALLVAAFRGMFGLEPEALSLLHVLFMIKSALSNVLNITGSGENGAQHYRLPEGVNQITDGIAAKLGSAIHVNSPVRNIVQSEDHVVVSSDTVSVKARRVIVATSTVAVNFIRFNPILPPDRAQLQHRMPMGSFWKIWLVYDEPFWRKKNLSGQIVSIAKNAFVANARDCTLPGEGQPGLLACFIDADKARELAHLSREKRRETIIREVARGLGKDALNLSPGITFPATPPQNPVADSYFEWNWSLPEWIRGDYAGAPGPGVYTAYGFGPAIREPFGRVHWAGSDAGTVFYGGMNGAVEAGGRAATDVLTAEPSVKGASR